MSSPVKQNDISLFHCQAEVYWNAEEHVQMTDVGDGAPDIV